MITDREIQALFADDFESDSQKKKNDKPKAKSNSKSRSTKKKAKISFDPDIFLDGITKEPNETEDTVNTPLDFFSKNDSPSMPPEFSNLIGRITFKNLFCLYDDSNNFSHFFTPESFDIYADRFNQVFLECNEYSKISYDTLQIKSLRKKINNLYTKIKKDFQAYPELLQSEINELAMSQNNYNNLLNTRKVQERSQKNRELSLNCKKIEQKILYNHYSKKIEFIKDSHAKYSQYLEINEFNKSITMDKISDAISSLKEKIIESKKNSSDALYNQEKIIQKLKDELKMLRDKSHIMQQNQMCIAFSCIKDEGNNKHLQNSFMNQNNSMIPTNNQDSFYYNNDSALIQQSQRISSPQKRNKSKNQQDSFTKIQKSFNSLLKEQNRNLENTSDFIKSVEDDKITHLMRRSYYA